MPSTVAHAYRVLSMALRQGVKWQVVGVNAAAAVSPPKADRPHLVVPTPEAIRAILDAAEGTRYHVPLTLAAAAGLARGEALGLRWRDVQLDEGTIRVVASLQRANGELRFLEPKTDRSRRTVSLPAFAVEVLRRARKEQTERRLFLGEAWVDEDVVADRGDGRPLEPAELSRAFHRLAGDGIRLHDLRHAFGSALLEAGIHPKVASEALGHSSVAFTMDTYQHLLPTMGSQVAAAIETALVAPSRREVARATGVAQSTRQRPKCLQQMCGLLATTSPSQRKQLGQHSRQESRLVVSCSCT